MRNTSLFFIFSILFSFTPIFNFSQVQIGDDLDGESSFDNSGYSISLSSDGTIVAVGAIYNNGNGEDSGHVRIYENIESIWEQIGNDIDGVSAEDYFGFKLSLSFNGDIVVIGVSGTSINSGHVRVFENLEETWTQIGDDIVSNHVSNLAGPSVSVSSDGNVLAIGIPEEDVNGNFSGQVKVFENLVGIWTQIGVNIDGEPVSLFGSSVSLSSDGSIIAIGAPWDSENGYHSGHVRVFENLEGTWSQIGDDINGEFASDISGASISLTSDGNIVAIGSRSNDDSGINSGQVRIYENVGGSWLQIGEDIEGEAVQDESGTSIDISDDGSILAIGAVGNDGNGNNSGHVRIFKNVGGVWIQIGGDINGENADDQFGRCVSLSSEGSVVAVGAHLNDGNGENSGHVRVYDISDLLSTEESTISDFNLYPNPTNSTINLKVNINITSVEVYNLLGQQILSTTPNTLTEEINMSGFNSGMYLVKVKIGEQTATYKVVKE